MLLELTIQDFAIIEKVQLRFEQGFNVLTGETGAGKSIIIDAVSALLGGRTASDVVRRGTDRALVEGLFALTPEMVAAVRPVLDENGLLVEADDEDTLILRREINVGGRSLCRVNGRAVSVTVLRNIAAPLVDIHGQSEHLSLMNPRKHIDMLDRFANTLAFRAQVAEKVVGLRRIRESIARLMRGGEELAFRTDRLRFVVDEISAAALQLDEEEQLNQERKILANSEKLSQLADEVLTILSEGTGDDNPGVLVQAGQMSRALLNLARVDESMSDTAATAEQVKSLLDDLARTMDRYRDTLEFNPTRLEEIEKRLTLIYNLKRKHGADIPAILETLERAQEELDEIAQAETRLVSLRADEQRVLQEIGTLGAQLSQKRRAAAKRMAGIVVRELGDLRMERAQFEVKIVWNPTPDGAIVPQAEGNHANSRFAFDATGIDQVEFLLAPNPGEGLKPLARIASGGEAARIMLAIKTALGQADDTPTLIFDEIDTGVGGRVGAVVGGKLHALADNRQVLCITHLPQLAAYGDKHFHIRKEIIGNRTRTLVLEMNEEARVVELAQMIGGGAAAVTAAEELRAQVQRHNTNGATL